MQHYNNGQRREVSFAPSRTQRIRDMVQTLSLEDDPTSGRRREKHLDITLPDMLEPWGEKTMQRLSNTGHTPRRTLGRLAAMAPHYEARPPKSRRPKKKWVTMRPPSEATLDKARSDWACGCGYQFNAVHSRVCVACATSDAPLAAPQRQQASSVAEFDAAPAERLLAQLEHDSKDTCQVTVELLKGVLQDIVRQPKGLRFRKLRLANGHMRDLLADGPGAPAASGILMHLGFARSRQPPPGKPNMPLEELLQLPVREGDAFRCGTVFTLCGEWLAQRQRKAEAMFSAIDSDGDGSLTMEEMKGKLLELGFESQQAEGFFKKIDADGDGNVTHNEFIAALAKMSSEEEELQRFSKKLSSGDLQMRGYNPKPDLVGAAGAAAALAATTWEAYASELSPLALCLKPARGEEVFLEVHDIAVVRACDLEDEADAYGLPVEQCFVITKKSDGVKIYLATSSVADRRSWLHELALVRLPTLISNSQVGFSATWLIDFMKSEAVKEQYSVLRSIGPSGVKIIEGPTLVDAENNPHDFEEGSWATLLQLCPEFGQAGGRYIWANSAATEGDVPPTTGSLIDGWLIGSTRQHILPYIDTTRCLWETFIHPAIFGQSGGDRIVSSEGGARSYAEHIFKTDRSAVAGGALGQPNLFVSQSLQSDASSLMNAIEEHCKQRGSDTRDVFCWLDELCTTHTDANTCTNTETDENSSSNSNTPRAGASNSSTPRAGASGDDGRGLGFARHQYSFYGAGAGGGGGGGDDADGYRGVFSRLIRECGHTLAVLNYTPDNRFLAGHIVASRQLLGVCDPDWMHRLWCLTETFESLQLQQNQQCKVSVGLSLAQKDTLKEVLISDPKQAAELLSRVDVRHSKAYNAHHKEIIMKTIESTDLTGGGDGYIAINVSIREMLRLYFISVAKEGVDKVERRHRVDFDGDGDIGSGDFEHFDGIDGVKMNVAEGAKRLAIKGSQEATDVQNEEDCTLLLSYIDLMLELSGPCDEVRNICIEAIRLGSGREIVTGPLRRINLDGDHPTGELMELKKWRAQLGLVRGLAVSNEIGDAPEKLQEILSESGRILVDAHWRTHPSQTAMGGGGGADEDDSKSNNNDDKLKADGELEQGQSAGTAKAVALALVDGGKQLRVLFGNAVMQTVPVEWVLEDDWKLDEMMSDYTGQYVKDASVGVLYENHAICLQLQDRLPLTGPMDPECVVTLRRQLAETWNRVYGDQNEHTLRAKVALAESLINSAAGGGDETTAAAADGMIAEANGLFEGLMDTLSHKYGANHPLSLEAFRGHALLLSTSMGDHAAARPLLESVTKAYVDTLGSQHATTLQCRQDLAAVLEALDEGTLARMEYEAVITTLIALKGQDHADSLAAKSKKAVLRHRQLDVTSKPEHFIDSMSLIRECVDGALRNPGMGSDDPRTQEYLRLHVNWKNMKKLVTIGEVRYNPKSVWVKITHDAHLGNKAFPQKYWTAATSDLAEAEDGESAGAADNEPTFGRKPPATVGATQTRRLDEPDEGVSGVQPAELLLGSDGWSPESVWRKIIKRSRANVGETKTCYSSQQGGKPVQVDEPPNEGVCDAAETDA